jgi:hypothetical protein
MTQIQVRAFRSGNRHNTVSIFVDCEDGSTVFSAKPIEFEQRELYEANSEPYLEIPKHAAQKLIDDLWDCGLRPSEGSGSAGQLAAVQNHLADLRKLLSKVPLVGESK